MNTTSAFRISFALVACAAATALMAGLSPSTAAAGTVECGDEIHADTTLTHDLVNCPNNGILIGADGITLNLHGHTIDGNGKLVEDCPQGEPCDLGVANPGHSRVTIKGGKIRQFGYGVLAFDLKRMRIRAIDSRRNTFNGIVLANATRSSIDRSAAIANGLTVDFPGIAVFELTRSTIKRTESRGNADLGLYAIGVDHNRIVHNEFSGNSEAGAILEGDSNLIAHNLMAGNGDGIPLTGNGNRIIHNRIVRSRGFGKCACGNGISLEEGHGNLIAGNTILGATNAGIRLTTFGARSRLADNVVRRNRVHGTGVFGIQISSAAKHTRVKANHVSRAADDGIRVQSAATTLAGNVATHNGDLGIDARPGVKDGGGNQASGNGNPLQCTNVVCG